MQYIIAHSQNFCYIILTMLDLESLKNELNPQQFRALLLRDLDLLLHRPDSG